MMRNHKQSEFQSKLTSRSGPPSAARPVFALFQPELAVDLTQPGFGVHCSLAVNLRPDLWRH